MKLADCREKCKMTFSLSRRRTKVLREGKKWSNQRRNSTKLDALYCFNFILYFKIDLFYCFENCVGGLVLLSTV